MSRQRSKRAPVLRPGWIAATLRCAAPLAVAAWAASAPAAALEPMLVAIGTGGKTGVYYLAGGAICDLMNDRRWSTGIRCLAESTDGSIDNLKAVRSGAMAFGIVQSDWHDRAAKGVGAFAEAGPDRDLRSVFGLFPEPFTVVARPDTGVAAFADLVGKRVDLGPAGSGGRATMTVVMNAMGWSDGDFAYVSELGLSDLPRALCSGEIDAAVVVVANPNLTLEDMVTSCGAVLVPVTGPKIDRLIADNPYYFAFEIPAGTYPGQATSAPTFALAATLVTSSRTSPAVVYDLTRTVFENFDAFRGYHPAFAGLERSKMLTDGLTAPFHEGALRYFEEAGLRPPGDH